MFLRIKHLIVILLLFGWYATSVHAKLQLTATDAKAFANRYLVIVAKEATFAKGQQALKLFLEDGRRAFLLSGNQLSRVSQKHFIVVAGYFKDKIRAQNLTNGLKAQGFENSFVLYSGNYIAKPLPRPLSPFAKRLCTKSKSKPSFPKTLSIYYIKNKILWNQHPGTGKTSKVMKMSKTFDAATSGPFGTYLYVSKGLKLYQIHPKSQSIRPFRTLKDAKNNRCETLTIQRNTLRCLAVGSGPSTYHYAKTHKVTLPRQRGKKLYQHTLNIKKIRGSGYQVTTKQQQTHIDIFLTCESRTIKWGRIDIPKNHKPASGKPSWALAPNGRVIFAFFPTIVGDLGVYGSTFAIPYQKKAIQIEADTRTWPNRWSPDKQWLLHNQTITNFAGTTWKMPKNAIWGTRYIPKTSKLTQSEQKYCKRMQKDMKVVTAELQSYRNSKGMELADIVLQLQALKSYTARLRSLLVSPDEDAHDKTLIRSMLFYAQKSTKNLQKRQFKSFVVVYQRFLGEFKKYYRYQGCK